MANEHYQKFICKLCKFNLSSSECLRLHLQICGQETQRFQCHKCDQIFQSNALLFKHLNTCGKFMCFKCDKPFLNVKALDYHIETVHRPKTCYNCSSCQFQCASRSELYNHRMIQHGGADQEEDLPEYSENHPNQDLKQCYIVNKKHAILSAHSEEDPIKKNL